jgi:hypothetical protein
MKKEGLHIVSIFVGSILALAIAFSQYLTTECVSSLEKTKTEQASKNAGSEKGSFISLPSFSIPAPVNVESNLDAYCLFEILFEVDIDENYIEEDVSYADRFFETMFRVIISPNAP